MTATATPAARLNPWLPPGVRYVGNVLTGRPRIAIVGSRAATEYGTRVAWNMALALAGEGCVIVSGLAFGIDAAAHRGALAAHYGRTLAVMPCGVDVCYPKAHRPLYDQITEHGMIVSAYEDGQAPSRERFLERNGLIAQIADVVVVVEAAARSGSMSTVRHAQRLGTPVAAVPGPVTSISSRGCHDLIRAGAHLVTGAADVLALCTELTA